MVIQLKFDLLCMLSGPEKKVRRIVSLFSFFQQNSRWSTNHMLLWRAWTASPICSKEATYPGHLLIRFWCASESTFSRGLHTNLVTVLYFSIINVLCGAGGDASFAPQANLVCQLISNFVIDTMLARVNYPRSFQVRFLNSTSFQPIELQFLSAASHNLRTIGLGDAD